MVSLQRMSATQAGLVDRKLSFRDVLWAGAGIVPSVAVLLGGELPDDGVVTGCVAA